MRRSFKDHIRGFCRCHGYPYEESGEGSGWTMDIGSGTVIISQEKDHYELRTEKFLCQCKPSAWCIATMMIEHHMEPHIEHHMKENNS